MIRLFAVLLVLAMLIPGTAIAEDTALPYLAVGAALASSILICNRMELFGNLLPLVASHKGL